MFSLLSRDFIFENFIARIESLIFTTCVYLLIVLSEHCGAEDLLFCYKHLLRICALNVRIAVSGL
jgi:hypothetical protein